MTVSSMRQANHKNLKFVKNFCIKALQAKLKPCNLHVNSPLENKCVYQQPTALNHHHLPDGNLYSCEIPQQFCDIAFYFYCFHNES